MRKLFQRCLTLVFLAGILLAQNPRASAYELGDPWRPDLRPFIHDPECRDYVEMMVDYHLRTDSDIQNSLKGGFAAVFLFDGCSDNMKDPELSDLSYYRVSGVCLVVKLDDKGVPKLIYFNEDASTIPDQPLKYGAWNLPDIGDVGPATICDGTYQLYGVHHKGEYEALHVRTDYRDGTLEAIYMTPNGFAPYRANEINVHTRTSNHIATYGMWSAGCPLVGDGSTWDFKRLIHSAYYTTYDSFEVGNFVGTLTIDRQQLRQELYTMYKNPDAVDAFLANSRAIQPEMYFQQCSEPVGVLEPETRVLTKDSILMDLPCTYQDDARASQLMTIPKGARVTITGSIRNAQSSKWYAVSYAGKTGYLFTGDTRPEAWSDRFRELITGK